ncbi:MAG: hypothetical protein RR365_01030 [Bacteroides sp.]
MEKNAILNLAFDMTRGVVPAEYSDKDPSDVLRQALVEANGGSTKINRKNLRRNGAEIYEIIEELIPCIVVEGLRGDEFYMNLVEERRAAEGDNFEFWAEANSSFVVSTIADGIATPRRQRIGEKTKVSVTTYPHIIRMYEEWSRFMANRIDWGELVNKVSTGFKLDLFNDIFTTFSTVSATTPGLSSTYVSAGTYSEEALLSIVEHVEAATDKTAYIIGTKAALRKCTTAVVSDEAKSAYYNGGFYGKVAGVDMVAIKNRHQVGSTAFILPDNVVFVIASDDKPIKVCYEGEGEIKETSEGNADMSIEYVYLEKIGVGLLVNGPIGKYTISA